ncbi:cell surface protein possibly involved in adhesion with CARDB domain [Methanolobus tindarius DSM 2278]|uniref:Cell surface protein possibly involved in adhesion with CARDB domain n=1 Tax=Methanolobus tindarius DSM 2278 TaxID=1090322 RepID=W9DUL9_METTI|nr:hypothetical protein [Methanolobus tindarius]ETA67091.1 cell surface protein possibly involved in adhesion with CARDB domain [Methanolobus tindarius DSM 2278]
MIKNINFKMVVSVSLILSLLFVLPVSADTMSTMDLELPDFFNFDENYYTVYGGPDVSATLVGDNEYSRGDEVTLKVNLMNKGVITGFKSEEDDDPVSELDQKIQQTEMGYEAQRTTAIGIVAILTSDDPNIRVKSGAQEAGTLASGEQTSDPLEFNIEVSNNAPAGEYPLNLTLYYGYQENVQINGDNETDLGITNMEVGLWYAVGQQMDQVSVIVDEEADFEVTNVTGELVLGEEGIIRVTYKNTGEEAVKDATVRISSDDPFSTTDDQSFIGSLEPGESAEAVFKLAVDETGVAKNYAINSEIKYEDMDGHSQTSDTVKITTEVLPAGSSDSGSGAYVGIVVVLIVVVVAAIGAKKFLGKKEEDN